MKHVRILCIGFAWVLVCATLSHAAEPPVIDDFTLLDQFGRQHRLYTHADVPVIVLYSFTTGCPVARQDAAALNELGTRFKGKAIIALLDPSTGDDRQAVFKEATELGTALPVLLDASQIIASRLHVDRTGEAMVIRTKDWRLVWRGPVDDRLGYGAQKAASKRNYLAEAIDATLSGTTLPADAPSAKGCKITFIDADKPVGYTNEVAPWVATHCVECHREGGIGPFSLNSYEQLKARGAMINEVLQTKRMPPWGSDSPAGVFRHDNVVEPADVARFVRWVNSGSPRGSGPDPLEKPLPDVKEWPLGEPDLIVECPEQKIPATGVLPYIEFFLSAELKPDAWVRAVDIHPSQRSVMHHAVVFLAKPAQEPKPGEKQQQPNQGENYFAEYVPGLRPEAFPEGTGKFLAKGTRFSVQLHYTTNGKAAVDHPKMGIYYATKPPSRELKGAMAINRDFVIPPGERDAPVTAKLALPRPIKLYGMAPHMHLRGSRMTYEARLPDGTLLPLLNVPRYDFNWQSTYWLTEPRLLPAGTTIICTGAFDNSRFNENNPDPSKPVRWGLQSFEEMFIGYIFYAEQ